jgi:hypothetical protein
LGHQSRVEVCYPCARTMSWLRDRMGFSSSLPNLFRNKDFVVAVVVEIFLMCIFHNGGKCSLFFTGNGLPHAARPMVDSTVDSLESSPRDPLLLPLHSPPPPPLAPDQSGTSIHIPVPDYGAVVSISATPRRPCVFATAPSAAPASC